MPRRARSIVLKPSVMAGLVASFGVKLDVQFDRAVGRNAAKPSACHPERLPAIQQVTVPTPVLTLCSIATKLESQHLDITASSVVLADAKSMVSTTRNAPHTAGGSQITVTDVGT
jgi:hypothetical protein